MSMSLLKMWWTMVNIDAELSDEPIKDDAVILNFVGSGASCFLTKRQLDCAMSESEQDKDKLVLFQEHLVLSDNGGVDAKKGLQ